MFRPDFGGHFYRFLVSTGLALVGLAFTLPWLIFRQTGILLTPSDEIKRLTPNGQKAVEKLQGEQYWWLQHYWYFFVPLVLIGVSISAWGFIQWYKRQLITDRKDNADTQAAEYDVHRLSMTEAAEEANSKAEQFIADSAELPRNKDQANLSAEDSANLNGDARIDESTSSHTSPVTINTARMKIEQVEADVRRLLAEAFEDSHRAVGKVELSVAGSARRMNVDILLMPQQPNANQDPLILAEIKLFKNRSSDERMRQMLSQLTDALQIAPVSKSGWRGILVAVIADDAFNSHDLRESLLQWWAYAAPPSEVALLIMNELAVRRISPEAARGTINQQWFAGGTPAVLS